MTTEIAFKNASDWTLASEYDIRRSCISRTNLAIFSMVFASPYKYIRLLSQSSASSQVPLSASIKTPARSNRSKVIAPHSLDADSSMPTNPRKIDSVLLSMIGFHCRTELAVNERMVLMRVTASLEWHQLENALSLVLSNSGGH